MRSAGRLRRLASPIPGGTHDLTHLCCKPDLEKCGNNFDHKTPPNTVLNRDVRRKKMLEFSTATNRHGSLAAIAIWPQ